MSEGTWTWAPPLYVLKGANPNRRGTIGRSDGQTIRRSFGASDELGRRIGKEPLGPSDGLMVRPSDELDRRGGLALGGPSDGLMVGPSDGPMVATDAELAELLLFLSNFLKIQINTSMDNPR